jgi:hypothetical protein
MFVWKVDAVTLEAASLSPRLKIHRLGFRAFTISEVLKLDVEDHPAVCVLEIPAMPTRSFGVVLR